MSAIPDALALLRTPAFWWFYVRAGNDPLDKEILQHFDVNDRGDREAVVRLSCGGDFALEIAIVPDIATVNLGLRSASASVVSQLGWWDDARWHPHALRWCELERLHNYWVSHPDVDIHPSAAFLLLAIFVGNGFNERACFPERKDTIRHHYEQLHLFTPADIDVLVDQTFVVPSEDDYCWGEDHEFGWVFGGEYPCYSIRNREHSGGFEGLFPYSGWSTMIARLPPATGAQ